MPCSNYCEDFCRCGETDPSDSSYPHDDAFEPLPEDFVARLARAQKLCFAGGCNADDCEWCNSEGDED